MADEKLNQDQAPERIENPSGEISADDLDQVSGGMQGSNYIDDWPKVSGNLVNGDGKGSPFGDVSVKQEKKI